MKLKYLALVLLVIGIILVVLSYSNLYSLNSEDFDSSDTTPLLIAAHSFNDRSFYISIGSDLKKVGVYVNNVAGEGWINHPFEMALINGKSDAMWVTEAAPPGGGYYIYDVPNTWNTLGGARIHNPESYEVAVDVGFTFFKEILNIPWLIALIIGIFAILTGAALIILSFMRKPFNK